MSDRRGCNPGMRHCPLRRPCPSFRRHNGRLGRSTRRRTVRCTGHRRPPATHDRRRPRRRCPSPDRGCRRRRSHCCCCRSRVDRCPEECSRRRTTRPAHLVRDRRCHRPPSCFRRRRRDRPTGRNGRTLRWRTRPSPAPAIEAGGGRRADSARASTCVAASARATEWSKALPSASAFRSSDPLASPGGGSRRHARPPRSSEDECSIRSRKPVRGRPAGNGTGRAFTRGGSSHAGPTGARRAQRLARAGNQGARWNPRVPYRSRVPEFGLPVRVPVPERGSSSRLEALFVLPLPGRGTGTGTFTGARSGHHPIRRRTGQAPPPTLAGCRDVLDINHCNS
jgi:hypothetical protein